MPKQYELETRVFDALPHMGRTAFDKALLGRIGDKKVSGEEKDIAKHVPYTKKHQYIGSRILTNPVTMGLGAAGFAAIFHKIHEPMLRKALTQYKKIEHKRDPMAKALRHFLAGQLKDPDKGSMMKSVSRIKQVASKSPTEVRKSVLMSGLVAGGATALGRYLHPRALKGEAIMEKERYHQRNPSEYIRTKLREDVELKRGQGALITKKAATILSVANKAISIGTKEVSAAPAFRSISRSRTGFMGIAGRSGAAPHMGPRSPFSNPSDKGLNISRAKMTPLVSTSNTNVSTNISL